MASFLPHVPSDRYEAKPSSSSSSIFPQSVLDIELATRSVEMEASDAPERMNRAGSNHQTKKMGICLTWKDLWVTASTGKNESISILQGLTGYAKPGQLLAIMGPSGCGKSTLLDALAGNAYAVFCMIFIGAGYLI